MTRRAQITGPCTTVVRDEISYGHHGDGERAHLAAEVELITRMVWEEDKHVDGEAERKKGAQHAGLAAVRALLRVGTFSTLVS